MNWAVYTKKFTGPNESVNNFFIKSKYLDKHGITGLYQFFFYSQIFQCLDLIFLFYSLLSFIILFISLIINTLITNHFIPFLIFIISCLIWILCKSISSNYSQRFIRNVCREYRAQLLFNADKKEKI